MKTLWALMLIMVIMGFFAPACRGENPAVEISPMEDLMREHGLLDRILLIYQEIIDRTERNEAIPVKDLSDAASIVRDFVENYHEKLEEDYIFPRFEKAGAGDELSGLARTLRQQHQDGRMLTDRIMKLASEKPSPRDRQDLKLQLSRFIRLYRPHKAREDTILFPAFHRLVSAKEYDRLGDLFEDKETALFGESGFEKNVDRVAGMEKKLGIYDLKKFSPSP